MASWQSPASGETEVMFRRGLLHPLGLSFLTIMQKACTKAQQTRAPIGSTTKWITRFATPALPFIYAIQYEWLVLLAFLDDHIRVVANILKHTFPPSTHLFSKIDSLIDTAETLPEKLDDIVFNFPMIIHRFPFLETALSTSILWTNFVLSTFTHWRITHYTKEKDIMVDINCDSAKTVGILTGMKGSYKEILERGKKELFGRRRDSATDQDILESYYSTEEALESDENAGTGSDENTVSEDPILELFDASWHMNPAKGTSLPAGSFTFT